MDSLRSGRAPGGADDWKPFPRREFDWIYGRVPRLTVEVLIVDGPRVLLARRDIEPCRGRWHIPGGTVRFGEHLTDAVTRIAFDEVGVHVSVGPQVGYIEYPKMLSDGYRGWPVGLAFRTTIIGGTVTGSPAGAEVAFFETVPPDTIAEQADFLNGFLSTLGVG